MDMEVDQPAPPKLANFIDSLAHVQPVIPDAVALHVMRKNGLSTDDPRIVRLISLATQKFVSDIALDAMQLVGFFLLFASLKSSFESNGRLQARMKGLGQIRKGTQEARFVLNSEVLEPVLQEYGVAFTNNTNQGR